MVNEDDFRREEKRRRGEEEKRRRGEETRRRGEGETGEAPLASHFASQLKSAHQKRAQPKRASSRAQEKKLARRSKERKRGRKKTHQVLRDLFFKNAS